MNKFRLINKGMIITFLLYAFMNLGCSSSNNISGVNEPYEKQDISGVWLGYLADSKTKISTFLIGIITEQDEDEYSALLIGQNTTTSAFKQFISPDGSYLTQGENSPIFTGYLEDCTWSTGGPDYSTQFFSDNKRESFIPLVTMMGTAYTRGIFGVPLGSYTYNDWEERGTLTLFYNTTFEELPNVNNLSGEWEMRDVLVKDNTVELKIEPNTASTSGASITGQDDRGNSFRGTISIYYDLNNKPHNIYNVFMTMTLKDSGSSINLNGLAAYVLESSTQGIKISKKTLAIGATNTTRSHFFSGLADFVK